MDCATIAQSALHWVWPRTCAHCREDLRFGAPGPLCLACRLALVPDESPALPGRRGEPALALVRSAFRYQEAAVSLVHAFKYRGRRSAARAAGAWMGTAFGRFPELGRPDALVPVPLHPARRRERGYNQALLLAEGLSERTGLPLAELLRRRRDTKPQWALDPARRRANLAGAIESSRGADGLRLLLVDDVCTTGASLEECARALRAAGAAWVGGFVFARQAGTAVT